MVSRRRRGAVARAERVRQRLELHCRTPPWEIGERREKPLVSRRAFSFWAKGGFGRGGGGEGGGLLVIPFFLKRAR